MTDHDYLERTLVLAKLGYGNTWPNPMVGAVLVKDGRIIGEGYHHKSGEDHAEIDAIKNATESVEGATLYVNLEPCCHTNKRTPPCTERIIKEKIKKVVFANLDPNPSVSGRGIEFLLHHKIEVIQGILKNQGEELNEVFFYAQKSQLPFVHLKLASSLDGKIATLSGESKWITGEAARAHVHELRSIHQGIVVGAQTLRTDNPKLNVRLENYEGPQPKRIIFTKSGKLDPKLHVLSDKEKENTLIYTQSPLDFDFPADQVTQISTLKEALSDLFQKKIINVFLEGGSDLATNFLKENLVQRVSYYINPSLIGSGKSAIGELELKSLSERPKLTQITSQWIEGDFFISGKIQKE